MSLNQYINTVLAQAVGRATPPRGPGWPAAVEVFDPLVRRFEKLAQQIELALAGRAALPDTRTGQGFRYHSPQPAQPVLHESETPYKVNATQSHMTPEDPVRPDIEASGDTP